MLLKLIVLAFLIWCGYQLYKGWKAMRHVHRAFTQAATGGNKQAGHRSQAQGRGYEPDAEYTTTGQRKRYRSDEGEYVEFEEITSTAASSPRASQAEAPRYYQAQETQIIDAEFEEIK